MSHKPVGPRDTTRMTPSHPQEPPNGADVLIVGGAGGNAGPQQGQAQGLVFRPACKRCSYGTDTDGDGNCAVCSGLSDEQAQGIAQQVRAAIVAMRDAAQQKRCAATPPNPDDAVSALRDAIADVTGHHPWVHTTEESIAQLREWAKRPRPGHDQIECQRAEIERLRADLARVVAERDEARAVERTYHTVIDAHKNAARDLNIAMYGEVKGAPYILTTMRAATTLIANLRVEMQRFQGERDEARATLTAVRASLAHECQRRDEMSRALDVVTGQRDEARAEAERLKVECADAVKAEVGDAD